MWKAIFRRLLLMIPQLLALSVLVFFLAELMPGDALTGLIDPKISAEQIEAMREKLGLNKPVWERYINWMGGMLQGDFGRSFAHKQPTLSIIGERIWPTVWLSLLTTIITYAIALPLGILSGRYNGSFFERAVNFYNFFFLAIPSFVLYLFMIALFGFGLGWFPTSGSVDVNLDPGTFAYYIDKLKHLILPGICLALLSTVSTVQYLRNEVIDAKQSDYVKTARAKGVPVNKVYSGHIFRNSILPIAAFFGFSITGLFSGGIFVETIFGYPGMGQLFYQSILDRDYSVVTTLMLFSGFLTLLGSMLSDIIMAIVDPRIKLD